MRKTLPTIANELGFTLVEAVMVIVLTGLLASVVAIFMRAPVQGYLDSARRAEMTDIADTSNRRIARDLRLALPNSVRVTQSGGRSYLEFLLTSDGGRYRADTPGDILDFDSASDSSFDVLGPAVSTVAGAQNLLAIYNLGVPGADAYAGDTTSAITSIVGNKINFSAKRFPFASPSNRFQIISYPVSYVCDPVAGTLTRYFNYAISSVQPTSFTTAAAQLATSVSSCAFSYSGLAINQRIGTIGIALQLTQSGEIVSLYNEVHVSNVP